jgi:hypothetical protein
VRPPWLARLRGQIKPRGAARPGNLAGLAAFIFSPPVLANG